MKKRETKEQREGRETDAIAQCIKCVLIGANEWTDWEDPLYAKGAEAIMRWVGECLGMNSLKEIEQHKDGGLLACWNVGNYSSALEAAQYLHRHGFRV